MPEVDFISVLIFAESVGELDSKVPAILFKGILPELRANRISIGFTEEVVRHSLRSPSPLSFPG